MFFIGEQEQHLTNITGTRANDRLLLQISLTDKHHNQKSFKYSNNIPG